MRRAACAGRALAPVAAVCLGGCASLFYPPPDPASVCLGNDAARWSLLATPPANAGRLLAIDPSRMDIPPDRYQEHWFASGAELLVCHRMEWCPDETWRFAPGDTGWRLVEHHEFVCVADAGVRAMPVADGTP